WGGVKRGAAVGAVLGGLSIASPALGAFVTKSLVAFSSSHAAVSATVNFSEGNYWSGTVDTITAGLPLGLYAGSKLFSGGKTVPGEGLKVGEVPKPQPPKATVPAPKPNAPNKPAAGLPGGKYD